MTDRPVIACLGNCQSGTIRGMLQAVPEISRDHEIVFVRNRHDFAALKPRLRACILQVTHGWDGFVLSQDDLPAGATLIRYPAALATWLWPTIPFQRRNKDVKAEGGVYQQYPYTICDDLALRLVEDGVPRERFVEAYFEIDLTRRYPLDRLRDINAAKAGQIDARADFGIWGQIERHGAEQQLFRTANHPDGPLMAYIMAAILERLPFVTDTAHVERLAAQWRTGYGVQPVEAPVHPQVAEHFGLEWAPPDRRWAFWSEGRFTFEERLLRLYDFRYSRSCQAGRTAMKEGRIDDAVQLFSEAVDELPGSAETLTLYAMALTRAGDLSAAADVRGRIFALEPTPTTANELIGALNRARRQPEARQVLEGLEPPLADDPIILLARSRAARADGLNEAADAWFAAAAEAAPEHLQVLIEKARRAEAERRWADAVAHLERAHYVSNWSASVGKALEALRGRAPAA